MPSPISFSGTIASRGYAEGRLHLLARATVGYRPPGTADREAAALTSAIATAVAEVTHLIETTGGDGADILEFQLAMLEDDALADPAFLAIGAGANAADAWITALDTQVAEYEAADDPYFRARAADVADIRARVTRVLSGGPDDGAPPPGAVLVGDEITPSQFLTADWRTGGGIVLSRGSTTSHVAMLARSRGVPMLVGVAGLAANGQEAALVDAEAGTLTLWPTSDAIARARSAAATARSASEASVHGPAVTTDGTTIAVHLNVAAPEELAALDPATCDGIGLMRTEFLYSGGPPQEEVQYAAYRRVVEWAAGRPAVIRTVDAGGDKPVPGFTIAEQNPFLGLRGIRLALARPDVFRVQIRALLRAAVHGDVRVMFPMISVPTEFAAARDLFRAELESLTSAAIPSRMPALGIMVEVPAVAIAPEAFTEAAFFSIGSNDLTQYVMAAGRDNGDVAALADVTNTAVRRLIADMARFGRERGIPVSLCGDAGGDPAAIPHLLKAGIRSVSVAPALLGAAKRAIAGVTL